MPTTQKPFAVVGADLDMSLVQGLDKGDKVILEMNGVRVPDAPHPLIAVPWTVIGNDQHLLRLATPHLPHIGRSIVVDLPHENLVNQTPAVFRIFNSAFGTTGPIYVLIQFVAYYATLGEVGDRFKTTFKEQQCREALDDDRVKMGILENLHGYFSKFDQGPFQHKSIKRFALRSRVKESELETIRTGDFVGMMSLSDDALVNIMRECVWLPHLMKLGSFISFDEDEVYQKQ